MNSTGFDKGPQHKTGRYDSEAEILAKIDLARAKALKFRAEAEEWDKKADALRDKPESSMFLRGYREEAKKLREQATHQETIRLRFLSNKLATFRTELLPGVLTDRSIPKVGSDKFTERTTPRK